MNFKTKMLFKTLKAFSLAAGFALSLAAFSNSKNPCAALFGSLRYAENQAAVKAGGEESLQPKFLSFKEDMELAEFWGDPKISFDVKSLMALLPPGVFFVDRRQRESRTESAVKIPVGGAVLTLQAYYKSQGRNLKTNVYLGARGLAENLNSQKKWLIGPNSNAAILNLHGGGTKSTGGHTGEQAINFFEKFGVSVISPDLFWHAEGPRVFMGNFDQDIQTLFDFTEEFIHPDVPIFVMGHSWGGSIAHKMMQLSDKENQIPKNIKGFIIASPAVDPAPGRPIDEKMGEFFRRQKEANERAFTESPLGEEHFALKLLINGKISPVGEFYTSITLAQMSDNLPDHKGDKYLPALMVVGEGDPLVYLGFEDLFKRFYDSLTNVEAHYLGELPLFKSAGKHQKQEAVKTQITGHLINDSILSPDREVPALFDLAKSFIEKTIGKKLEPAKPLQGPVVEFLLLLQNYANELAFREWIKTAQIVRVSRDISYQKIQEKMIEKREAVFKLAENLSPRREFLNFLNNFLESDQEGAAAFENFKLKMDLFKKFFDKDNKINSLFSQIAAANNAAEAREAIEKLAGLPIFVNPGKKELDNFRWELLKLEPEEIQSEYPYLSPPQIQSFLPVFLEFKALGARLAESYIPSLKEFTNSGFSEAKAAQKIDRIKENVKERKELAAKFAAGLRRAEEIKKVLNKNLERIEQYSKRMQAIFEEADVDPPASLKAEFDKSRENLFELLKISDTLQDNLRADAFKLIKEGVFSTEKFLQYLDVHEESIGVFFEKYESYAANRIALRKRLVKALQNGDLSHEAEELAVTLYSRAGLYSQTEKLSVELAELEAEQDALNKKIGDLTTAYNMLIPYEGLSQVENFHAADFLNVEGFNKADLEKNADRFRQILKSWKQLGSHIPPPLPE